MNPEKLAHLNRILENRRNRGASVPRGSEPVGLVRSPDYGGSQAQPNSQPPQGNDSGAFGANPSSQSIYAAANGASSPAARPPAPHSRPQQPEPQPAQNQPQYSSQQQVRPQPSQMYPQPSQNQYAPAAQQEYAYGGGGGGGGAPAAGNGNGIAAAPPPSQNQFMSRINQTMGRPPTGQAASTAPPSTLMPQPTGNGQGQGRPNPPESVASSSGIHSSSVYLGPPPPQHMSSQDLFQKGTFANFKQRPLLVSPAIRSYRKEDDAVSVRDPSPAGRRSASRAGSPTRRQVMEPPQVTERNPFRTQDFDEFVQAPQYEVPKEVKSALDYQEAHQLEGSVAHALHEKSVARTRSVAGAENPVYDIYECVKALEKGDWFLKWTRNRNKVHRRYFWLDVNRSVLFWANTPDAFSYLSSSMRIEDICSIEAQCVVDDVSGKTLYLMVIVGTTRHVQLGTEIRDKFDVWFDTLQRLSETVREYNARYYQRYAGSKYQAQTKPNRGGGFSSAD